MTGPEPLGEQLVHEIVRCVLHHLDLLEHDLLLALDITHIERWPEQQVG